MGRRRLWFIAMLMVCALVIASCATTPDTRTVVTGTWMADNFNKKFSKVLIVAVSDEFGIRGDFEKTVARRLDMDGVRAEPSSDIMPLEQKIDRESVKAAMAGKNFNAVLVARLIGMENESTYVPPSVDMTFDSTFIRGGPTVDVSPEHTVHSSVVTLQFDLFDTETEHIVWSMKSQTFNLTNVAAASDTLADAIASDLKAKGLI